MNEKFEVTWYLNDGIEGEPRPHHFPIYPSGIEPMSEEEARKQFREMLLGDFQAKVSPVCDQEDKFVTWWKQQIAKGGEAGRELRS